LIRHLEDRLGIRMGETTKDGLITLKRMECLASCGTAPAIQIDGIFYERMTPQKLDELLERLRDDRLHAAGTRPTGAAGG
jgi:NADH-quinone oxidoreductase subunit E